jgi:rSAM/selenodomain-associated transferase 1
MPTGASVLVIVFARAPVPGRAKTRLAARIGAWRAARLQARLTVAALRTALAARCGPVELHCAPSRCHAFFRSCARKFDVSLEEQRGMDLGARMYRALARGLRRHRGVILIGSDCPELRAADLRRAGRLLRGGHDVVLAPAEDGGYALIACRRVAPALFERIVWGGPRVFRTTVERLERARLRWRALRTVWDVDRPEDLARLAELPRGLWRGGPSPRSRRPESACYTLPPLK